MNRTRTYPLRELASLVGLEPRTIRNWISSGLIPGPITTGRNAQYGQSTLDRLRFVKIVRERTGLPLAEIRRVLMTISDDQMRDVAEGRREATSILLASASFESRPVSEPPPRLPESRSVLEPPFLSPPVQRARRLARPQGTPPADESSPEPPAESMRATGRFADPWQRLMELKRRSQRFQSPASPRAPEPETQAPAGEAEPRRPDHTVHAFGEFDILRRPAPATPRPPGRNSLQSLRGAGSTPRLEQMLRRLEDAFSDPASPRIQRVPRRARSDWWASIRVTPDLELRARGFEGDDLARLERIADLLRHVLAEESTADSTERPGPAGAPSGSRTSPQPAGTGESATRQPRKE